MTKFYFKHNLQRHTSSYLISLPRGEYLIHRSPQLKSEPILNPVHDLFFRVKTANIQCLFQWAKDKKVIWRKIQAIGEYFNTDNRNFMRFLIENVEVHPSYESMTVHLLRVLLSLSNVFVCTHMHHVVISSHTIQQVLTGELQEV